jgi:hypothetical protein
MHAHGTQPSLPLTGVPAPEAAGAAQTTPPSDVRNAFLGVTWVAAAALGTIACVIAATGLELSGRIPLSQPATIRLPGAGVGFRWVCAWRKKVPALQQRRCRGASCFPIENMCVCNQYLLCVVTMLNDALVAEQPSNNALAKSLEDLRGMDRRAPLWPGGAGKRNQQRGPCHLFERSGERSGIVFGFPS